MNNRYMTIDIKEVLDMVEYYQEFKCLDSKTIMSDYLYNLVTEEMNKYIWGQDDEYNKRYILIGA